MIVPVDALFRAQRESLGLRMYCEECVLFDDERERCAHGYPVEPHRAPRDRATDTEIHFCKDFEAA